MSDELRINGNDIELGGEKIARLFDLSSIARNELQELFDKANYFDIEIEREKERNEND
tara:strand:- start:339 stop:512 length:174 start_codon:yes stop_codon:yes gene_type:complete